MPCLSAVFDSGPPASRAVKLSNVRPYLLSSPGWQNGRSGHSGGPPSTRPLPHLAARSDSVFTPYLSANAVVTANVFWSAASAGSPNFRPDRVAELGQRRDGGVEVTAGLRGGVRAVLVLVDELGQRPGVLRHDLDLALLQRRR